MNCKVEKTDNANEVKLEITVEAKKFDETMKKIYFKTDKNFRKTQQLFQNPQVALCCGGIQVEGIAKNLGLVVEQDDHRFEELYRKYLWQSYNAYSHEDSEILIEVTPKFVEIWDEDEKRYAFQTFIDFDKKTVVIKNYD